ncbi:uncharacterized protein FIBRA_01803 [Fibroporia radiculosa]|uniref:COP9 signalosome complex subunit 3 n=1 Tax=Fibroporia radiculosa TaxID=599839 RepID=J4I8P7_9APHY|nr:uncharacterized protein FIBRA_01803 [Fibroporia radiculosa]CCL99781.1 predicted protein [Fibroporia radiculosa]
MNPSGSQSQSGPSGSSLQSSTIQISIDDLLNQIVSSDNPRALVQILRKDAKDSLLVRTLADGQDPLSLLDVERHTLGFLYILTARLQSNDHVARAFDFVQPFCDRFDPFQARLAPERVTQLGKEIVRATKENPKAALGPLYKLVTRYPPSLSHLTTLHPLFLTTCVATRHYTAALPLLLVPITLIDMGISNLHYNDNLIYHYAGGVALAALKRWREAEEFFEICASSPAQIPAAIQMEASKKLVLVQLILYGKTVPPPKYTNPVLQRTLKNSPYGAFIKAYPLKRSILQAITAKETEIFSNEKNLGLVHQAIERAPRWLIKKLTSTYLTLGLADIAKEVGIDSEDELRAILISMIESDEIGASISADGTVTFFDPVPQVSKEAVDEMLKQAQVQGKMLLDMERSLNANKDYLTKAIKHKDEAGWGPDEDMFGGGGPSGWVEDFA